MDGRVLRSVSNETHVCYKLKNGNCFEISFIIRSRWCGHCKNLAPTWAEAASKMANQVRFGAVDATSNPSLAQEFDVKYVNCIPV